MAAPKKPQAKRVRNARGAVYVPKGSYQATADARYLAAKEKAGDDVPKLVALKLAEQGVSARMIAATMGVSLSAIRDRAQGKTQWRVDELLGLAAVYGFSIEDVATTAVTPAEMDSKLTADVLRGLEMLGLASRMGQLRLDVSA